MELVDSMINGNIISMARLISLVESGDDQVPQIMKHVYPHTGKAYRIGLTGPPGVGKSTLVDKLTSVIRSQDLTAGIIAVDPTSPFSGGAVLGDRIRMQQHYLDQGVFIRSMATRGSLGGLPKTASEVINIMDASGKDIILIETVGVGQSELDIIKNADTVVVILAPGAGDSIQTMKAGLLEIADIFVINKADNPGADDLVSEIQTMLQLNTRKHEIWEIPVIATQAINNYGVETLYQQIHSHHQTISKSGVLAQQRKEQRREQFINTIEQEISAELLRMMKRDIQLKEYINKVEMAEIDPYSAAYEILSSATLLDMLAQQLLQRKRHND